MIRKKLANAVVALLFVVLTVIGLTTCDDYGVPCDEDWEQQTLRENMHEYAVQLWGEDSEQAQQYKKRGIERISQSTERDHGQSAYYAFAPLLDRLEPHKLTQAWHVYTWLWFMAGVWALYAFARETGLGRFSATLGAMLLYLCPRFFAEGHYNNKDMVLLSLVLCTLWLGVRFLKKPGVLRGILFSLAGAMAANTKIVGAFAWGVFGLCAVVLITASRRWNRRMALTAVTTILAFALFYTLLTPAVWAGPLDYLKYLLENASGFTRWTGVVLFRDQVIDQQVQPLPRYYLIWMMAVTLPLYVLPLAGMGQLYTLARIWKQKKQALADPVTLALAAASLCWLIPLAAAVLMRPTLYNGWRHFYFIFAGLAVLGAHGIRSCIRIARYCGGDCGMHGVFVAALVLFYAWTGMDIARNHPYQYAYYNRLGHEQAETMELDYWYVSSANAMQQLLETERNEKLPLVLGAQDVMSWLSVMDGCNALTPEQLAKLKIKESAKAPYLLANSTYARIYGTPPPKGYHELIMLDSYDIPICIIYEKD